MALWFWLDAASTEAFVATSAHLVGSGPWITNPETLMLRTLNVEPPKLPPPGQFPDGTQPTHCED